MKREKIKLRPTGLWLVFGPILGCMWLAAVNYSNNLIYGILYLVGSLIFVSIFHTWRNLALLEVDHLRVHSAFAGAEVRVEIHLRNPARHSSYGLSFSYLDGERSWHGATTLVLPGGGALRVNGGDMRPTDLFFPSTRRGLYHFDSLLVRSSYPFGLINASFRLPVGTGYFVYPEPRGASAFPELRPSGEEGFPVALKSGDDFSGVRVYLPGESLRHVDWKAYARGRPLSVKQFTGGDGRELWLDGADVAGLPLEARLSQLALWVVNAEKEDIPYALHWGATTISLGLGPDQSRRALETLAVAGARF
jgi:uncharacterized protein (DUF58 family)